MISYVLCIYAFCVNAKLRRCAFFFVWMQVEFERILSAYLINCINMPENSNALGLGFSNLMVALGTCFLGARPITHARLEPYKRCQPLGSLYLIWWLECLYCSLCYHLEVPCPMMPRGGPQCPFGCPLCWLGAVDFPIWQCVSPHISAWRHIRCIGFRHAQEHYWDVCTRWWCPTPPGRGEVKLWHSATMHWWRICERES